MDENNRIVQIIRAAETLNYLQSGEGASQRDFLNRSAASIVRNNDNIVYPQQPVAFTAPPPSYHQGSVTGTRTSGSHNSSDGGEMSLMHSNQGHLQSQNHRVETSMSPSSGQNEPRTNYPPHPMTSSSQVHSGDGFRNRSNESPVNHNFSVAKRIYDNQTVMQGQPSTKSYFPNKNEDAPSSRWSSQPHQKQPTIIIVNQFVPPQYDKNCSKQDKIPYESLGNLSKLSAISQMKSGFINTDNRMCIRENTRYDRRNLNLINMVANTSNNNNVINRHDSKFEVCREFQEKPEVENVQASTTNQINQVSSELVLRREQGKYTSKIDASVASSEAEDDDNGKSLKHANGKSKKSGHKIYVDHTYVDFSGVNQLLVEESTPITGELLDTILLFGGARKPENMITLNNRKEGKFKTRRMDNFPKKLMRLLDDEPNPDVITWLPHGRAFVVLDTQRFLTEIHSKYYNAEAKSIKSFQRKLNMWGFKRMTGNRDHGAYYHQLFLKGYPNLIRKMVLTKRKNGIRPFPNPKQEPNFYILSELRPLKKVQKSDDKKVKDARLLFSTTERKSH